MTRTRSLIWLVVLFIAAWGLLAFRIGGAWVGHQDANGAWISSAIRNYERYGFANLGGMIVLNHSPVAPSNYEYYTSHPPIPVWLPTMPVLLVGYDEAVVRFVFAACTLLSIAALYALVRSLFGQTHALWSAAFYAFTPMTAYFGRMPDHEAPAMLFLLMFAWVLVLWLKKPTRRWWLALAALMLLQAWTAWGGLISTVVVCMAGLSLSKPAQRRALAGLLLIGAVGALLLIGFFQVQWSGTVDSFVEKFIWRTSNQSFGENSEPFTMADYLLQLLVRVITLFTPTICLIALLGIPPLFRTETPARRLIPLALLLGGLGYMLLFRNASFIHDYYLIYVTPAAAILAAVGLTTWWNRRRVQRWMRPVLVGLLLVTPLALWRYVSVLYQGSDQTDPLIIAEAIRQSTDTDALIMSNLPTVGPAIEFYAGRNILWNVQPADAAVQALNREGVFYFHCGETGELPPGTTMLSDAEVLPGCSLTQIG